MAYTLPNTILNGTTGDAGQVEANFLALLSAANNSIAADGSIGPSAAIAWNGQNLTGVGALAATTITRAGYAVWDAGNFNPGNYAALTGATFTGPVGVNTLTVGEGIIAGLASDALSLDVGTPNIGSTGAIRIRANAVTGNAIEQITNFNASTQFGYWLYNSTGLASWLGAGGIAAQGPITQNGYQVWNSNNLTAASLNTIYGYTPYNSTNPSGYISGITSAMVTGALGYTPLSGITGAMVTTALGYTPANRAGDTFTGGITVQGVVDGATPGAGTTGGLRARASASGPAIIQFTDVAVSTELATVQVTSTKITFFIRGTAVASIDNSGNIRALGNVYAAQSSV